MLDDPRLNRKKVRVPRRDDYERRPILSATIHPALKRTLVAMSERTGMTVSQVTDEVLYKCLVESCMSWKSLRSKGREARKTQQSYIK